MPTEEKNDTKRTEVEREKTKSVVRLDIGHDGTQTRR